MRSLERALAQLDIERLQRRTITIEVFHHTGPVEASPDLKVKAFASVLGTDTDQDLFGIPAFQAPVVNVPVPGIAFFKWQRSRAVAEVRLFVDAPARRDRPREARQVHGADLLRVHGDGRR